MGTRDDLGGGRRRQAFQDPSCSDYVSSTRSSWSTGSGSGNSSGSRVGSSGSSDSSNLRMFSSLVFPDEVRQEIFSRIDRPQDIVACCLVSRQWARSVPLLITCIDFSLGRRDPSGSRSISSTSSTSSSSSPPSASPSQEQQGQNRFISLLSVALHRFPNLESLVLPPSFPPGRSLDTSVGREASEALIDALAACCPRLTSLYANLRPGNHDVAFSRSVLSKLFLSCPRLQHLNLGTADTGGPGIYPPLTRRFWQRALPSTGGIPVNGRGSGSSGTGCSSANSRSLVSGSSREGISHGDDGPARTAVHGGAVRVSLVQRCPVPVSVQLLVGLRSLFLERCRVPWPSDIPLNALSRLDELALVECVVVEEVRSPFDDGVAEELEGGAGEEEDAGGGRGGGGGRDRVAVPQEFVSLVSSLTQLSSLHLSLHAVCSQAALILQGRQRQQQQQQQAEPAVLHPTVVVLDTLTCLTGLTSLGLHGLWSPPQVFRPGWTAALPPSLPHCLTALRSLHLSRLEQQVHDALAPAPGAAAAAAATGAVPSQLPVFFRLTGLTELRLCHGFSIVPASLSGLTNLTSLSITHCPKLLALPVAAVARLSALVRLDVSHCRRLLTLPATLAQLTLLRELRAADCRSLGGLPRANGAAEGGESALPLSLRVLDVRGGPPALLDAAKKLLEEREAQRQQQQVQQGQREQLQVQQGQREQLLCSQTDGLSESSPPGAGGGGGSGSAASAVFPACGPPASAAVACAAAVAAAAAASACIPPLQLHEGSLVEEERRTKASPGTILAPLPEEDFVVQRGRRLLDEFLGWEHVLEWEDEDVVVDADPFVYDDFDMWAAEEDFGEYDDAEEDFGVGGEYMDGAHEAVVGGSLVDGDEVGGHDLVEMWEEAFDGRGVRSWHEGEVEEVEDTVDDGDDDDDDVFGNGRGGGGVFEGVVDEEVEGEAVEGLESWPGMRDEGVEEDVDVGLSIDDVGEDVAVQFNVDDAWEEEEEENLDVDDGLGLRFEEEEEVESWAEAMGGVGLDDDFVDDADDDDFDVDGERYAFGGEDDGDDDNDDDGDGDDVDDDGDEDDGFSDRMAALGMSEDVGGREVEVEVEVGVDGDLGRGLLANEEGLGEGEFAEDLVEDDGAWESDDPHDDDDFGADFEDQDDGFIDYDDYDDDAIGLTDAIGCSEVEAAAFADDDLIARLDMEEEMEEYAYAHALDEGDELGSTSEERGVLEVDEGSEYDTFGVDEDLGVGVSGHDADYEPHNCVGGEEEDDALAAAAEAVQLEDEEAEYDVLYDGACVGDDVAQYEAEVELYDDAGELYVGVEDDIDADDVFDIVESAYEADVDAYADAHVVDSALDVDAGDGADIDAYDDALDGAGVEEFNVSHGGVDAYDSYGVVDAYESYGVVDAYDDSYGGFDAHGGGDYEVYGYDHFGDDGFDHGGD